MNLNSPCGPDIVVTLGIVGLNTEDIDGIVLVSMLASRSEMIATTINNSLDYFEQFNNSIIPATSDTLKQVRRFSSRNRPALTQYQIQSKIDLSRASFSGVALTAGVR